MKTIRKLSALLIFCAALLIGFGGTVHAEEAAGTKTVYITASTKSEMIIEPTAVTGREDQTVKELLAESGHEFAGLEDGWIVSIDGVTGNYRRFFDGNAYQLDTKLKDVTVLCFTEAEDAYSENMLELIRYLGQYRAKEDYEKLQKYEREIQILSWPEPAEGARRAVRLYDPDGNMIEVGEAQGRL